MLRRGAVRPEGGFRWIDGAIDVMPYPKEAVGWRKGTYARDSARGAGRAWRTLDPLAP